MGHTNSTPNLHLPQFIGSDKPTWLSDVNGAMLAIDTAYGTIEANASSAATAAAGAVTVAGAAQTAADSAATAAATAGTNASQALSTANNAASTANNAYNEAHEALSRMNGEVLASVEGDGVKTIAQLLNDLYALVDLDEITDRSYLKTPGGPCALVTKGTSDLRFTGAVLINATRFDTRGYVVSADASLYCAARVSGTSVSIIDGSSDVATVGQVYAIYK